MAKTMLHTKATVNRSEASMAEGVIEAVIGSSNVTDRMGDVIDQNGWDLTNYKNNPVILWGHNVTEERPPIGKALKVWVEGKGQKAAKLMFKVKFDLQDSFAAEIFRKVKDGFVNTVSVGFMPVEWEALDDDNPFFGGHKFLKQELLELSFVPVPANPEAIVTLRGMGVEPVADEALEKIYNKEAKAFKTKLKKDADDIMADESEAEGEEKEDEVEELLNNEEDEAEVETPVVETPEVETEKPEVEDKPEVETPDAEAHQDAEHVPSTDAPEGEEKPEDKEEVVDEPEGVKQLREILTAMEKSGRVLSSKNESKVRQAVDLLSDVLSALDKEEPVKGEVNEEVDKDEVESKKALPYKELGTEPESAEWDGPGEMAKAEVTDLKDMCAWYDSEDSENKSAYKLPHHKAENKKAVWRGVAAAMASLLGARGGVDIPEEDRKAVYNHLVKHYKEFDKEAPEFKAVEAQVLASYEEEIHAVTLDREDKHLVRLVKKVLKEQKEAKKIKVQEKDTNVVVTKEHFAKALEVLNLALSKVNEGSKKEVNE